MIVICVAGGRVGVIKKRVYAVLDALYIKLYDPDAMRYVHGGAMGIDRTAGEWAKDREMDVNDYPIDSTLDGDDQFTAPKRRNRRMFAVSQPDILIAFPGANGTNDACKIAEEQGCRILEVEFDTDETFVVWEWHRKGKATRFAEGKF